MQTWKHLIECSALKPAKIKMLQKEGAYYFVTIYGSTVNYCMRFYYELENLSNIKTILDKYKVSYKVIG